MARQVSRKGTLALTNAGIIAGGLGLGYVAHPHRETAVGATLSGAAGSLVAVGIILFLYDLIHDRRLAGNGA